MVQITAKWCKLVQDCSGLRSIGDFGFRLGRGTGVNECEVPLPSGPVIRCTKFWLFADTNPGPKSATSWMPHRFNSLAENFGTQFSTNSERAAARLYRMRSGWFFACARQMQICANLCKFAQTALSAKADIYFRIPFNRGLLLSFHLALLLLNYSPLRGCSFLVPSQPTKCLRVSPAS